jgi:hypothetical protein
MNRQHIWDLVRRALLLDDDAFEEIRAEDAFTALSLGAAAAAVFLAGIGAWLFGLAVLDSTPDGWFLDTVFLGSFFTLALFAAGAAITYLLMTRVFQIEDVPVDEFARVILFTHAPYGLGLFVFLPEIGFAIGMLSIIAVFFYSVYGLGVAFRGESRLGVAASVLAGLVFWLLVITLISGPGSNYATGVFVFSLID